MKFLKVSAVVAITATALIITLTAFRSHDKTVIYSEAEGFPITMCGAVLPEGLDFEVPVLLMSGLSDLHFQVTTDPLVQKFFDQGLRLVYGFNQPEAIRSFKEAARLDPSCAMTWWGQALVAFVRYGKWNEILALPLPDEGSISTPPFITMHVALRSCVHPGWREQKSTKVWSKG